MVLNKGKFVLALLIPLIISFACGYLFSSKFCSVTINKRVNKISTLNHMLRRLFALRTFYIFEYDQSQEHKIMQDSIRKRLNIANQEISNLIAAYYDKQVNHTINQFLDNKINPEEFTIYLAQLNPTWAQTKDTIKQNLIDTLKNTSTIHEALSNNNWDKSLNLFENNFRLAMELSDVIDHGITEQFPHKF